MSEVTILQGDCIEVMASLPAASIDAIVTDPPYGLGFVEGKKWDDLPPGEDFARAALRLLKPGGHLLAFGGTRTFHRLAVAIEDAGLEIRDSIAWLHSQGMPKGKNLKPAFEPIVVARKRGAATPLNIEENRIEATDVFGGGAGTKPHPTSIFGLGGYEKGSGFKRGPEAGRWPTNAVLDEYQAEMLGDSSRYFYVAKAPKSERPVVDGVAHPTVKPLMLMRHLIRLVTPVGGVVLDPFVGSGTTIEAAILEGYDSIGIERDADYLPLIQHRINRQQGVN